jgi:signal transduction histidine kinase
MPTVLPSERRLFLRLTLWGTEYSIGQNVGRFDGLLASVEFSTLVRFSRLVADSSTSESVSALLAETVVTRCGGLHALVFGTDDATGFTVLSSYGECAAELENLNPGSAVSVTELRDATLKACGSRYAFRALPLISNAGLFGFLGVLYSESEAPAIENWSFMEGLAELTAISLNKTYQHQRLQQAFDNLRASQEVLIRTEKFRALGQMSAGIAHDLKNLLNPMQLYTDHLRDVVDSREEVLDTVTRMDRILTRGLETVERLREFSRLSPEHSDAVATDLNAMVHEALEISKAKLAHAKLVLKLGEPPDVLLRPGDCITAMVNLIFNAAEAITADGTITVRTGSSDGGAWVEVEDDGPGIPLEIRNRIVEPFFTTKGNQGTGLGVSIVFTFTQKHGGRLDIESEPGHGARFRMWFPAAP